MAKQLIILYFFTVIISQPKFKIGYKTCKNKKNSVYRASDLVIKPDITNLSYEKYRRINYWYFFFEFINNLFIDTEYLIEYDKKLYGDSENQDLFKYTKAKIRESAKSHNLNKNESDCVFQPVQIITLCNKDCKDEDIVAYIYFSENYNEIRGCEVRESDFYEYIYKKKGTNTVCNYYRLKPNVLQRIELGCSISGMLDKSAKDRVIYEWVKEFKHGLLDVCKKKWSNLI